MPIVSKETLSNLENEKAYLEAQLADLEPMVPNLQLAQMLRDEMVAMMGPDGSPQLSAQQIGEIAYNNVLRKMVDKAREELTAKYESEHRKELYERVIKEVEDSEGPSLYEQAKTKIESDPELAVELRDSARKELGSRAVDVLQEEITADQQKIVDAEAERQLNLDRLDVKFALERELDLSSEAVKGVVKVGDKLVLFRKGDKDKRNPIVLTWTKDANDAEGWIVTSIPDDTLSKDSNGYWNTLPVPLKFVKIGSKNMDLQKGEDVIQPNKLVIGLPLAIIFSNGRSVFPKVGVDKRYGSYQSKEDLLIDGTDFQTKDIVFTQSKSRK